MMNNITTADTRHCRSSSTKNVSDSDNHENSASNNNNNNNSDSVSNVISPPCAVRSHRKRSLNKIETSSNINNSNSDSNNISPSERSRGKGSLNQNETTNDNNTVAIRVVKNNNHKTKDITITTSKNKKKKKKNNNNSSTNSSISRNNYTAHTTDARMTNTIAIISSDKNSDHSDSNPGTAEKMETTIIDSVGTDHAASDCQKRRGRGEQERSRRRRWWNRLRRPRSSTSIVSLTSMVRNPPKIKAGRARLVISHPHFSGLGATVVQSRSSVTDDVAAAAASASPSSVIPNRPHLHQDVSPSRLFPLRFIDDDDPEGFPEGISLSSASDSVAIRSVGEDPLYAEIETPSARDGRVLNDDVPRKGLTMILGESEEERRRYACRHELVASDVADSVEPDLDTARGGMSCRKQTHGLAAFKKDKPVTLTDGVNVSHTLKSLNEDRCRISKDDHKLTKVYVERDVFYGSKDTELDPSNQSSAPTYRSDDILRTAQRRRDARRPDYEEEGDSQSQRAVDESNVKPKSPLQSADSLKFPTEDDVPSHIFDIPVYQTLSDCDTRSEAFNADRNPAEGEDCVLHWLDNDLEVGDQQDMYFHRTPLGNPAKESHSGSGTLTLADGASMECIPQDQIKGLDGSDGRTSSLQNQMFQNDCSGGVDACLVRENFHNHTAGTHTEYTDNAEDEEQSSSDDRSATVTDGETVYHILHRLDQDLEDHMVTETLESSVDVVSLSSSSLEEPWGGLYSDLDQSLGSSAYGQNSDQPCLDTSFERLDVKVSPFQHVSQMRSSSVNLPRGTYRPTMDTSAQGRTYLLKESDSAFTKSDQSLSVPRQMPVDVRRPDRVPSKPAANGERPQTKKYPDEDFSLFTRNDVSKASSPVLSRFNSELDSYEVNPLQSSTTKNSESVNLYAEGFVGKGQYPDLARHHRHNSPQGHHHRPLGHSTNSRGHSLERRVSSRRSIFEDTGEEKVAEELANTLDYLGRPESNVLGSQPKFYSVQRRKLPHRKRSEASHPTFFTMQRNQSATPWMKSDSLIGSIRSRPTKPTNPSQGRFSVEMALPTGLTKLTKPGNRNGHVTATSSNAHAAPGQHEIASSAPKSRTRRENSVGKSGSTVRNPGWGSRQGKQPWWGSLFERQDRKTGQESPRRTSIVNWGDQESGEEDGRTGGGAVDSPVATVKVQSGAEDVVFGGNNVGCETASLF